MAQSHVFQSPGVDWAGQVTVFDSAGQTATADAANIIKPSDWNSGHNEYLTLSGNTAGASTMSGSNIILQGGNNVTLSANGATLVISGGAGGGGMGISAGTQSVSTGTMIFADSNGLAFGMSGSSQITGSYSQSTHSHATAAYSGSNGSFTANTLTFGSSNSMHFYTTNGSIVGSFVESTHSHATPAFSGSNGSFTAATVTFGSSNGMHFYTTNGSVVGSYTVPAAQTNVAFSADASSTFQTLTFQNSNNVSFSNNAGAIRVTHNLAGTSTGSAGANVGISMTHNSSGLNLSITAPPAQTNVAFSADASSTFQTLTFQNSNNVSFSNNAGAIRVTHNLAGTSTGSAGGAGVGISMTHNSSGLNLSVTVAAQTNQTLSFAATSNTTGNTSGMSVDARSITLQGRGNVSVGYSTSAGGSSIVISGSVPVVSNAIQLVGSATGSGTNVSRFAADDHVHAGVFSMGVSNLGNTIGDTKVSVGQFVFQGSGITLSQITGANQLNTIIISGASPGAAAITQTMGISNITAGGSTAGTTGGVTGDDIQFIFVPGSNITMSQSINGSSGTLTIYGPAAGGGMTHSGFNPYADFEKQAGQYGQGTLQFDPMRAPNFVMDRVIIPLINTNSSNSSGSHTLSFWVGIYSRNVSTLSLVQSVSSSTALTHSGTVGSYSLYSGNRLFTIPLTTTITEGDYWIGFVSRTTSGGTNGTYSNLIMSNIASNFLGFFGSAHNTTQQLTLGQGLYTATTSGIPGSVGFSQIRGSDSAARRAAFIMFANSTV